MPKETYRDNVVDVRKQGNEDRLYLNDKKVDIIKERRADRTIYKSEFTFGEFESLEALGRAIVDTQSSLTEPTLDAFKKPAD